MRGTIRKWNDERGFGFLRPDGGGDAFVHVSALQRAGVSDPTIGDVFEFDLEQDSRGRHRASNLRLITRVPCGQRFSHVGGAI